MRSETKHAVRVLSAGVLMALVLDPFAMGQQPGTVKITPVGARTGEYCTRDRALIFEDPTGIRILYDPGITVTGGGDIRLGEVHAILVSHSHYDHMGYQRLTQDPDDPGANCVAPQTVQTGNTTTAEIAAAKNSAVLVNGSMAVFLGGKIQNIRGASTPTCFPVRIAGPGPNELVVPRGSPCTGGLAFGTSRTLTRFPGAAGVRINIVPALHSDAVFNPSLLLTSSLGGNMTDDNLTVYDGLANGYVLTFTNGLKVYLSGDTGPTSDMAIMRDLYHPQLAVVNVDGVGSMGPEEAAYAMKRLVRPTAVIASHPEEPVTTNGRVNPETRTAQLFGLLSDMPVYVPLSGRTMEFDGDANCVGCSGRQPRRVVGCAEDDMGQAASHEAMRVLLVSSLLSATCFGQGMETASGTWKVNAARSTFAGGAPFKSMTVRIERHSKGEVFTMGRIETNGRTTNYSTILYLDGEPRRFEDFECSGIQSSRRVDERTVEIVRMCASGGWMRLLRRATAKWNELVLEITEQSADGRRFDRRLTLEKQ